MEQKLGVAQRCHHCALLGPTLSTGAEIPALLKARWTLRTRLFASTPCLLLLFSECTSTGSESPMKRKGMLFGMATLRRLCEGTWCCFQRSWTARPAEIWHCRCLAQRRDATWQILSPFFLTDTTDRGSGLSSRVSLSSLLSLETKRNPGSPYPTLLSKYWY